MRGMWRLLVVAPCLACASLAGAVDAVAASPIPRETQQIVLVVTNGWDAVPAQLQRFERDGAGWREVGKKIAVVVGKNGIAWGAGLHPLESTGPRKKEGDNRAPAGVFRLRGAFGYEPREAKLSYSVVTRATECIDDPGHDAYNTVVDTTQRKRTWSSAEVMRRDDELYRLGLYVDHNVEPIVKGAGSCIFMHVWRGSTRGTAGCTAMPMAEISVLVDWLDAAKSPVLVQLPRAEYERLHASWGIPTSR